MSKPKGRRLQQVSKVIFDALSEFFAFQNPLGVDGFVGVTRVNMTADFKQATVYFRISTFSGRCLTEEEIWRWQQQLNRLEPQVRHYLAQRVNLRFTPRVSFVWDYGLERVIAVEKAFQELQHERFKKESDGNPDEFYGNE